MEASRQRNVFVGILEGEARAQQAAEGAHIAELIYARASAMIELAIAIDIIDYEAAGRVGGALTRKELAGRVRELIDGNLEANGSAEDTRGA
jgi:hypothetical protein